jgi:pimeloyl-ACP methyl ester carboxylesterase
VHWIDRAAGAIMVRSRSRLFPDGWGELPRMSSARVRIEVTWRPVGAIRGIDILDGTFSSPAPLPPRAATGRVRWFNPPRSNRVCLLLPASNEEGYSRRTPFARKLAAQGIGALLLENPYYGARRVRQGRQAVRTVGELLSMGSAAVQEAHGLLLGFDSFQVGVAGYSMGGNIAGLVAATSPTPLVVVPMAPSPSPAPVFTEGLLSRVVDWDAVGAGRAELRDVLDRASILSFPPPVRPELAIIVAARDDGYIPAEAARSIHRHWPGSELRWERGGHISLALLGRSHLVRAILDGFDRLVSRAI